MPIEMIEEFDQGTQIKVIGVGGGGGNAVEHMVSEGVQGVEFICANTDAQALNRSQASNIIQLGNKGLGAGGKPEVGRAAAEEAVEQIKAAISGANMLFITAGMGGGTGTGAAPVIARTAKEMGILTVGVVTKPFEFEGNRRMKAADAGVAELEANVDSLIVVLNEKLLEVLGDDVTQDEAFAHANDVLKNAVGGISDIIHIPGLVNVDFEDVKTVMSEPGKAMMGTAIAQGPDRATKAAEAAVACPLLEGIDLSGAKGVLVLIAASRATFKLSESKLAMNTIRRYAAEEAHVIFGTAYDETLGDQLRVTVIATGLSQSRRAQQPLTVIQTVQQARTGTDNMPVMGTPMPTVPGAPAVPVGTAPIAPAMPANPDYGHLGTPSVWRHRQHAAAKVEALSSHGMDEIEIPAFLRKQAD
jgi:cell division protein FtsZ